MANPTDAVDIVHKILGTKDHIKAIEAQLAELKRDLADAESTLNDLETELCDTLEISREY